MLKITLLLGVFDIVRCEMQTTRLERTVSEAPSCSNPPMCYLPDTYKKEPRSISFPFYPNFPNVHKQQIQRSYYGGFGSTLPAYYHHAFDPITVLASLAFLAFLLQSFATLFERSRSMLPTIVSGRQSDLSAPEIPKHVSYALQEYENLNEDLEKK
ncbi:uncharacterized protein [Temnothorax longispinosus]|uniref:uncharacterized protein n=1 Tax=Temnothorax longispinosus TaxID=300112 RepID=UPI003A9963BE